jgi:hypothetical protein
MINLLYLITIVEENSNGTKKSPNRLAFDRLIFLFSDGDTVHGSSD